MLCLVHPVNDRLLSLLNSVKYDSSLIFSVPLGRSTVFKNICELFILCRYSLHFLNFLVMQLHFQNFQNFFVLLLQFFFAGINSAQVFCGRV